MHRKTGDKEIAQVEHHALPLEFYHYIYGLFCLVHGNMELIKICKHNTVHKDNDNISPEQVMVKL